jgi:hypothetical protein
MGRFRYNTRPLGVTAFEKCPGARPVTETIGNKKLSQSAGLFLGVCLYLSSAVERNTAQKNSNLGKDSHRCDAQNEPGPARRSRRLKNASICRVDTERLHCYLWRNDPFQFHRLAGGRPLDPSLAGAPSGD